MPLKKLAEAEAARCEIEGYKSKRQDVSLNLNQTYLLIKDCQLGPKKVADALIDLVNLAFIVYQTERMQQGFTGSNRPSHYRLYIRQSTNTLCDSHIIQRIQNILTFMGGATWEIHPEVDGSISSFSNFEKDTRDKEIKQVALFSGGLDSTCGLALLSECKDTTLPVSFYTQQKTRQRQIVEGLNYPSLVQFTRRVEASSGRGRRSYYRSFFFLSLAALVAQSWGITRVLQIENGVLATSVGPGEAWYMTRHAHPRLHFECEKLFADVVGGEWQIENPALLMTKRELFQNAAKIVGNDKIAQLALLTETCWFHRSPTIPGGHKENNKACGLCVPCIIRRTALQDANYAYDLAIDEDARNDERKGRSFRDYFGFSSEILELGDDMARFYNILPEVSREIVYPEGKIELSQLHSLFTHFAREFMEAFRL